MKYLFEVTWYQDEGLQFAYVTANTWKEGKEKAHKIIIEHDGWQMDMRKLEENDVVNRLARANSLLTAMKEIQAL